jgi:hypothetical protein
LATNTPEEIEAKVAMEGAHEGYKLQGATVAGMVKTTWAGIIALLGYIEDFRAGRIALSENSNGAQIGSSSGNEEKVQPKGTNVPACVRISKRRNL